MPLESRGKTSARERSARCLPKSWTLVAKRSVGVDSPAHSIKKPGQTRPGPGVSNYSAANIFVTAILRSLLLGRAATLLALFPTFFAAAHRRGFVFPAAVFAAGSRGLVAFHAGLRVFTAAAGAHALGVFFAVTHAAGLRIFAVGRTHLVAARAFALFGGRVLFRCGRSSLGCGLCP